MSRIEDHPLFEPFLATRTPGVLDDFTDHERSWIVDLLRPHLAIAAESVPLEDIGLGQSHFGGRAHLPPSFDWPQCSYGPLRFLAQINFADIADRLTANYFDLPKNGWLVVFASGSADVQPGCWAKGDDGVSKPVPDLVHVEFLPANAPIEVAADGWDGWDRYPEYTDCDPRHRTETKALSFVDGFSIPDRSDARESRVDIPDEIVELIDGLPSWPKWGPTDNSGGHGVLMGWASSQRSEGTSPGPDWRNLISLGSDPDFLWDWCDDATLNVHVRLDGIASRIFSPSHATAC